VPEPNKVDSAAPFDWHVFYRQLLNKNYGAGCLSKLWQLKITQGLGSRVAVVGCGASNNQTTWIIFSAVG